MLPSGEVTSNRIWLSPRLNTTALLCWPLLTEASVAPLPTLTVAPVVAALGVSFRWVIVSGTTA